MLKKELENRFSKILNPEANGFSPTHLLATFLDPEYTIGLDAQKEKCIKIIAHQLGKELEQQNQNNNCTLDKKLIDLSKKKYAGWFKNIQLSQNSPSASTLINDKIKSIKIKLESYFEEAMQLTVAPTTSGLGSDSVKLWSQKKEIYGDVAKYALDLLAVPAFSAGIERVFSLASVVQGGRPYKLGAANTEKELFIKCNRYFIMKNAS